MNVDTERLGCRSPLVLMKLGFDLRGHYDALLAAPLPEGLQRLADRIDGYAEWKDVDPSASTGATVGEALIGRD